MKFKGEFEKEGSPYRIIMCRVLKRDVGRFEEALEKLKDKMLIMGYRDYDKVCADIGSLIGGEKERKKQLRSMFRWISEVRRRSASITQSRDAPG